MKPILSGFFILILSLFGLFSYSQPGKKAVNQKSSALKLPGDPAFEMKQYFFVMLSSGPNRSQDSITANKIQEGHMNNMKRLAQMGKLVVAGPFADDSNWKGI